MKQSILCLLIKKNQNDRELLLAMKKKGFGAGRWNGVGGKLDPQKGDKSILDTLIRETEEEIGVKIKEFEKVALLTFLYPYYSEKKWDVHVFLARNWEGEPAESEEMTPKWFRLNEIPFDEMWPDDKFWLPEILEGKKLKAKFIFEEGDVISGHNIKVVEELE